MHFALRPSERARHLKAAQRASLRARSGELSALLHHNYCELLGPAAQKRTVLTLLRQAVPCNTSRVDPSACHALAGWTFTTSGPAFSADGCQVSAHATGFCLRALWPTPPCPRPGVRSSKRTLIDRLWEIVYSVDPRVGTPSSFGLPQLCFSLSFTSHLHSFTDSTLPPPPRHLRLRLTPTVATHPPPAHSQPPWSDSQRSRTGPLPPPFTTRGSTYAPSSPRLLVSTRPSTLSGSDS